MLFGHIILQVLKVGLQQSQSISSYNWSVKIQKMLKTSKSFNTFRKVIATTIHTEESDGATDPIASGQLYIESRYEDNPYIHSLESERSKLLMNKEVKSSIESNKKMISSIPLSQLILKDNGYDHLFHQRGESKKLQKKYFQNLKQLKIQTEQMMELVRLELIAIQQYQIRYKIRKIERDISVIRGNKKSVSPIERYTEYLQSGGGRRKQRLSGRRLLQIGIKQNKNKSRSIIKTQCDSKAPSLPSAPVTPISQAKLILAVPKNYKQQYISILRDKKEVLQNSLQTVDTFYTKRLQEVKLQIKLLKKQISLINSHIVTTPIRKSYRSTIGYLNTSNSTNKNCERKILGFCSPRNNRQSRKNQIMRIAPRARKDIVSNPREQYYYRVEE